jgi:hypothetical protein
MKYAKPLITTAGIALLIISVVLGHRPDDWEKFDHRTFHASGVTADASLMIQTGQSKHERVSLSGIVPADSASTWLAAHAQGREVTLMLESPQTRNADGQLRAFVFVGNVNLNVELVKAGLAYADRRGKSIMDGLIDPAESDARKKKRGFWSTLTDEQQPAWRKAWVRSLPVRG